MLSQISSIIVYVLSKDDFKAEKYGKNVFYVCSLKSCSNSPDDFRDEQCAATSSIPFFDDNLVYDWTQFFAMGLVTCKCFL